MLLKILNYILKILILISIGIIFYSGKEYILILNGEEIKIQWLLFPLSIYFIGLFIINYTKMGLFSKIGISFLNSIFCFGIASLGYKLHISEYMKADYIINGFFFKLKRVWSKSDYLAEAEYIFKKKELSSYMDIDYIYNFINPISMKHWRDSLNNFAILAEQQKQLLQKQGISSLSIEDSELIKIKAEMHSFTTYVFDLVTDKHFWLGGSVALTGLALILLYNKIGGRDGIEYYIYITKENMYEFLKERKSKEECIAVFREIAADLKIQSWRLPLRSQDPANVQRILSNPNLDTSIVYNRVHKNLFKWIMGDDIPIDDPRLMEFIFHNLLKVAREYVDKKIITEADYQLIRQKLNIVVEACYYNSQKKK